MAPRERQLGALLQSLTAGHQPLATELTILSDLARDETAEVSQSWPGITPHTRESILARVTELAEDNVDLDFAALARLALDDQEPAVRRRAIAALWEDLDRTTALRLVALLRNDPVEQLRADAAQALAQFVLQRELDAFPRAEGDHVVEALRAAIADPVEAIDVRAAAIESLGFRSLPWVEAAISDAYYQDDRRLRLAALTAMGRSAQEKWIEYLDEDARSDDPQFRFEAAQALGAIGAEEGVDILAQLLEDEDQEVVLAALSALAEIGSEEAVRYLRDFSLDPPPALEGAARAALENALFVNDERGGEFLQL